MPRQLVRNFGSCINFIGGATTDEIEFADPGSSSVLDFTGALTFSVWARLNSLGPSSSGRFINKSGGTPPYDFLCNSSNRIALVLNGGAFFSNNNAVAIDFKWHMYSVTFDKTLGSNQINFYVDGVNVGSDTKTTDITPDNSALLIGQNQGANRKLDGFIDDVRMYNRALSETELSNLYYGVEPSTTGFVVHVKLDEGSGTTIADSRGNLSAGTLTGGAWSTDVFITSRTTV